MSYGRQQYQAHRPQFPPAPSNQGIGQNGPRQAGNARLPQGGIRRETWRPSVTSPERQQHRSAGGPSGYRDQNPPPAPFYPPPPPTGYDAYPAQPFVHPSRQVQPPFPPPNRYPDHPPPNPPAAFHTDRFVPPPLPRPSSPGFRDPPPPRDPSAFIHPSRRAPIPPAFASTSGPSPGRSQVNDQMQFSETSRSGDAVPPSRRAERRSTSPRTAPYSDRHGKGKARDDFSQDSRARYVLKLLSQHRLNDSGIARSIPVDHVEKNQTLVAGLPLGRHCRHLPSGRTPEIVGVALHAVRRIPALGRHRGIKGVLLLRALDQDHLNVYGGGATVDLARDRETVHRAQ